MSKFQKKIFSSIHKIWWHEWVWMKTCPPEVFWTPYHTHKPITRKNPLHFQGLVKKWRFFTNFFTSTKIFTCLVNKCWPKFFHDKKALIFPYTTLTSNFSYLLWSRKYFVLKIKYTRIRFSNNYLQIKYPRSPWKLFQGRNFDGLSSEYVHFWCLNNFTSNFT